MKELITNTKTLIIAIIGFVGGIIWVFKTGWEPEPVILIFVTFLEITAFLFINGIPESSPSEVGQRINANNQNVTVNLTGTTITPFSTVNSSSTITDRNVLIDSKKSKVRILFIDDDKKFKVVNILKESGWKHTKTVIDIKSLDIPVVREADIFFVDINGVGKLLSCENEGLDLAQMLKQKYPERKVIIYSANKNFNSFHPAWDLVDSKLEKNALPYQFQNLVENLSLELYN